LSEKKEMGGTRGKKKGPQSADAHTQGTTYLKYLLENGQEVKKAKQPLESALSRGGEAIIFACGYEIHIPFHTPSLLPFLKK
jgi:ABC-type uncharacterized transport system substrate-binding protein